MREVMVDRWRWPPFGDSSVERWSSGAGSWLLARGWLGSPVVDFTGNEEERRRRFDDSDVGSSG